MSCPHHKKGSLCFGELASNLSIRCVQVNPKWALVNNEWHVTGFEQGCGARLYLCSHCGLRSAEVNLVLIDSPIVCSKCGCTMTYTAETEIANSLPWDRTAVIAIRAPAIAAPTDHFTSLPMPNIAKGAQIPIKEPARPQASKPARRKAR